MRGQRRPSKLCKINIKVAKRDIFELIELTSVTFTF